MTGVNDAAWRPITAVAYVPGVMALRSDTRIAVGAKYRPLPHADGPMCDRCWMRGRIVTAIGGSSWAGNHCPHGGTA